MEWGVGAGVTNSAESYARFWWEFPANSRFSEGNDRKKDKGKNFWCRRLWFPGLRCETWGTRICEWLRRFGVEMLF